MRPSTPHFDDDRRRRHKLRNRLQTGILIGGMVLLLAACAYLVAGPDGIVWAVAGGLVLLVFTPRVSPRLILRLYQASEIPYPEFPELHHIVAQLSHRADLPGPPRLYYIPSSLPTAFSAGEPEDAVLAVTDGMLRTMGPRELAGVLAHEISHIRNHDLRIMNLADVVARITRMMAFLGLLLLIVALPAWVQQEGGVPWLLVLLLTFAPTLGSLMQLALSRSRELDADLDAAQLTGDPDGLASALAKLEAYENGGWERILLPGRNRHPDPSLLRTHPSTGERIERLRDLTLPADREPHRPPQEILVPSRFGPVEGPPRRRVGGFWY